MSKVKLCGMFREEDILYANEIKPDYIGFVMFFEKSRRNITPDFARKLKKMLSEDIKAVGVFVNAPLEEVGKLLWQKTIDIAQLHGTEDNEYIKKLKSVCDAPVIKAMRFSDKNLYENAEKSTADYILLDSGTGEGKNYDFSIARGIKKPYFLAGGLHISNVEPAVKELHPFAVDVSSGIETDGIKDFEKMKKFTILVHNAAERG